MIEYILLMLLVVQDVICFIINKKVERKSRRAGG